jgi:hypothetical protein
MSSNEPFESNVHNPYSFQDTPRAHLPPDMQRGLVHHVMALGILMIVQGSLVSLLGIGGCAMAVIIPLMLKIEGGMARRPGMQPGPPMPPELEWILPFIYGSFGVVFLTIGVLGIWAGIRMMKFKGRTLGFIALSSGLITIVGCYCLPTAIGLFIYGLIVLLNAPVKRAFDMGEQGYTANEIQNHFAQLPGS